MKPFRKALYIAVTVLAAGILLCSCGSNESHESGDKQKQENEKALRALEEIEGINESIIQLLGGPANPGKQQQPQGQNDGKDKTQETPEGQENTQPQENPQQEGGQQQDRQEGMQQEQGKEKQGNGNQEQEKGQQGKEQEQGQKQGQGQEQQQEGTKQGRQEQSGAGQDETPGDKIWDEINKNIIELHSQLNEYIPAAAKLGASAEMGENAGNALNQLTKRAEARNHNEVLTEANNLYKALCDYYSFHQDKRAPSKLLLYHARRVMLTAKTGDWQTSATAVDELEKLWNSQKTGYGDEQKEIVAMLDLSVSDLAGAVKEKNQNLAAIKGLVLINNISELESSLEQKPQE